MKKILTIPLLLILFLLFGCQTGNLAQFVVPGKYKIELLNIIESIATKHGLVSKLGEEQIKNVIAYFKVGEVYNSITLGARTYGDKFVVDLIAYAAGMYDKKNFKIIKNEVSINLKEPSGTEVKVIEDYNEKIPFERKDS